MTTRSKYKTVLWSVYLAIMASNAIWGLVHLPQNPKDFIGVVASFVWCVGLFGFIFQRRILHKLFWRIWFSLILIVSAIALTFITFTMFTNFTQSHTQLLFYGAALIMLFPMYYALYAYAYRSPSVWQAV